MLMKATPPEKKYVPALGYHWLTPYYDFFVNALTREKSFRTVLAQQAQLKVGQKILDLACGTGALAIQIRSEFPTVDVAAVDCDRTMLLRAQSKANQASVDVQFDRAYAENLPYSDTSFDRVVSSLFFHHLSWKDKKCTAREIYRILKPHGEVHVADWGRASNLLMRSLFIPVQLVDGFQNTHDNVSGKLVELFEQTGFDQVVQRQSFEPFLAQWFCIVPLKVLSGDFWLSELMRRYFANKFFIASR